MALVAAWEALGAVVETLEEEVAKARRPSRCIGTLTHTAATRLAG